ncbi:MAG: hypothetical protein P4L53_05495 [Candidatus Obscuribacterales bacterium]|nr:hypothetical protein [Candidatus Obscuribacterales bacterium]
MRAAHKPVQKTNLAALPLACTTFGDQSEIDVRIDATGKWETIATIRSVAGFDAEDIASVIVHSVSARQETQKILQDVTGIMGACLTGNPLSKKVAQEMQTLLRRAQAVTVI